MSNQPPEFLGAKPHTLNRGFSGPAIDIERNQAAAEDMQQLNALTDHFAQAANIIATELGIPEETVTFQQYSTWQAQQTVPISNFDSPPPT